MLFILFLLFFLINTFTFNEINIYYTNYPTVFNDDNIEYINDKPKSILIKNIFPKSIHQEMIDQYRYLDQYRKNRFILENDIIHSDILINNQALITKIIRSYNFSNYISSIVNHTIQTTDYRYPYSNFIQICDHLGNKLDWHYDLNFYQGNIFVGVYTLLNRDKWNDQYSDQQHCQVLNGKIKCFHTPENSLLVFQADKIKHKVSPISINQTRVVYQTLFTDNNKQSLINKFKMYAFTSEGLHLLMFSDFKL